MAQRRVRVESEVGLHARPAALFVQAAAASQLEITIAKGDGEPVNAKSILSVLSLDVRQGDEVVITTPGEESGPLADTLARLAASGGSAGPAGPDGSIGPGGSSGTAGPADA